MADPSADPTRSGAKPSPENGANSKDEQLEAVRVDVEGTDLTTQQGVRIDHTDDSLTVGERGPTLLEDFHAREKITHFDHERIPERVVHARGSGAHGYFEAYESMAEYTVADFLQEPGRRTPVFVRFSTVAGSRGSADTVRDVRGFATKFFTRTGTYDLVANNFPVFFIQDGIKFPDFVHAVKPEPHNEMPQAASAHDTFWDFVSLQPEAMHMVMWLMSDRAIPRSFRMMEGFGVHTFRFVNAEGRGTFVKFHWKPMLGIHSLVWDEAQKAAGKDPDFNRRDLWEAIESGHFPEWELGVQLVPESDEFSFDFDLLDPTKIIPEEQVPVRRIGKLVLNRNPDNFFAETEQVAFHTANIVPGIDFSNDPLLQARNFSYLDTQLIRLGGPNFAQLPINRPIAPVHNNQRDGFGQMRIYRSQSSYSPNSVAGNYPRVPDGAEGAGSDPSVFSHYQERVDGVKIRKRSESFKDFYSQATLFWNSMTAPEKKHIVAAFQFELGKCTRPEIRERAVEQINHIDHDLAGMVASGIGVTPPEREIVPNHGRSSPALSQVLDRTAPIDSRRVALLAGDGVDPVHVDAIVENLGGMGVVVEVLAPHDGALATQNGNAVRADRRIATMSSVLYDAVVVPGGADSARALAGDGDAVHFLAEAFKHGKTVGAVAEGLDVLGVAPIGEVRMATSAEDLISDRGVVTQVRGPNKNRLEDFCRMFAEAMRQHRHWDRETDFVPA
ncbi:catalase [Actinopolymorpha pittospori]|uniref:Catalase n=1 Tax=Actinopolymorpha pittospori TaxID=648752 RepID=A0A927RR07_9ACTN|nr:catalase [Actinopolymorpha pittospori]MBE1612828.1 catalase [Actinopolymorpha pittospori]